MKISKGLQVTCDNDKYNCGNNGLSPDCDIQNKLVMKGVDSNLLVAGYI